MYQATLELSDNVEYKEAHDLATKFSEVNIRSRGRGRGRAASKIPYKIQINIERLIKTFGELPVLNIFGFYGRMYEEVLDPEEYGFENGILELIGTMDDTIEVYDNGTTLVCRSKLNNVIHRSAPMKWSANLKAALTGSHFWNGEEAKYLSKDGPKIIIDPPPVASLFIKNKALATREFYNICTLLEAHPSGIPLLKFHHFYSKKYGRNFNLLYFNFASLCEMVYACPEIFFVKEDQQDLILYDGRYNTYTDLEGKNLIISQVKDFLSYLFEGHIIQKTLLIVDSARPNGLPVNIYLQTLQANFRLDENMIVYINRLTAITIFRMMAKLKLVIMKSAPECANDVRVFLTKSFDYGAWANHFQREIQM